MSKYDGFPLILLIGFLSSGTANAGGNACATLSSGTWSTPTIWDCGGGVGPPGSSDFVTIQNSHTVTLDQDATINNIVVAAGGDLDVGAGGHTLSWDEPGSDLSQANIDLAGNLTIFAESSGSAIDFSLGPVDGAFNLVINNDGNTNFTGNIGATTPLTLFSTDSSGSNTWSASMTTIDTQQHRGQTIIAGDVTLTASSFTIDGTVDADVIAMDRNLVLNSSSTVNFNASPFGATVPLNTLTVNASGNNLTISNDVTTTAGQVYNCDLEMQANVTLTATGVTFNGMPFSEDFGDPGFDLMVTGDATFLSSLNGNPTRGGTFPVENLTVTGNTLINIAGGGEILTAASQDYQGTMTLNSDTAFTSNDGGSITIRNSGGAHNLTINTSGVTTFTGAIGSPAHTSVTTNAGGRTICTNGTVIQVDSDTNSTTFNDTIRLGPSMICTIEQLGAADVIFNGPVVQFSGGPKRLIVNDVSGRTIFNDIINLGQLATNDGAGDDVTIINASSVQTTQGGSNNGTMTFNDPVEITQDVTFTTTNNGRVIFNNSLDEGSAATGSNIIINSANTTRLGPVGATTRIDSLTTNAVGSTELNGDVRTDGDQVFNDAVTVNANSTLFGVNLNLNNTVDLQTFDLTLNAEDADLEGVVSGSGNLISDIGIDLDVNADNTFTGQTLIRSGTLDLRDSPNNNALSDSNQISLASGTMLIPSTSGNQFDLAGSQTLSGTGEVQEMLVTTAGAIIRPGDNLGNDIGMLTAQTVMMNGATLAIQIEGTTRGAEPDRLSAQALTIDPSSTLSVEVISAAATGQQFQIITVNSSLTGEFNGLSEGSTVTAEDGSQFTITYQGGDGNDVILTALEDCEDMIAVTSNADSGAGTLRQAVADLCSGGTITFASDMTIMLSSEITVDDTATIDASTVEVVVSGNDANRVFSVAGSGDLTLNRITISNGFSIDNGGGVFNQGTLNIIDSLFTENESQQGGQGGGAIFNQDSATLVISGSTFTNNESLRGGAIFNNLDEFAADGMLTITNSTFSNNGTIAVEGGAIHNRGTMTATNITVANNGATGTLGGGIYTWMGDQTLVNTIVADNSGTGDCRIDLGNSTESNTASLIESGNCDAALSDDPELQPLADNGGSTQTLALALQSPAVNAGNIGLCPSTDQRGVSRPLLGDCDIGAYESENLAIIHVNQGIIRNGPPCVQGGCWDNPFLNLQDAIDIAVSGAEIWVAQGVYHPDAGGVAVNDDPLESFLIPAGVAVYGGFNGSEDNRDQRDPNTNITVLSGDIDGNDINTDGNQIAELVTDIQGTNAYHVITTQGASGIVLDGFTITAGSAFGSLLEDQRGGGINCASDSNTSNVFNDTVWIGNHAQNAAGAISRCNNDINNSIFLANQSDGFGGAAWFSGRVDMSNVSFINNSASSDSGAIRSSILFVDRGLFAGNQAGNDGGAIFATSNIVASNSLFSGNLSSARGGALYLRVNPTLSNVTLTGNRSTQAGGAIFFDSTPIRGDSLNIRNSIIWNNEDVNGVGTVSIVTPNGPDASVSFSNSLYQGSGGSANWDPSAGNDLGGNIDVDPVFRQDIDLMTTPTSDGDARLMDGSPALDVGDNSQASGAQDLDGRERIQNGVVDLGAYEGPDSIFGDSFEN